MLHRIRPPSPEEERRKRGSAGDPLSNWVASFVGAVGLALLAANFDALAGIATRAIPNPTTRFFIFGNPVSLIFYVFGFVFLLFGIREMVYRVACHFFKE